MPVNDIAAVGAIMPADSPNPSDTVSLSQYWDFYSDNVALDGVHTIECVDFVVHPDQAGKPELEFDSDLVIFAD